MPYSARKPNALWQVPVERPIKRAHSRCHVGPEGDAWGFSTQPPTVVDHGRPSADHDPRDLDFGTSGG